MLRGSLFIGATAALICTGSAGSLAAQYPIRIAQAEQNILLQGRFPTASDLEVTADCAPTQPGETVATFSWSSVPDRDSKQRVDITEFRNGFAGRDFETIAELPASQQTIEWHEAEAGINYYWRVLTLTPEGWMPSAVARFEAPTCPVDFERSDNAPQ